MTSAFEEVLVRELRQIAKRESLTSDDLARVAQIVVESVLVGSFLVACKQCGRIMSFQIGPEQVDRLIKGETVDFISPPYEICRVSGAGHQYFDLNLMDLVLDKLVRKY